MKNLILIVLLFAFSITHAQNNYIRTNAIKVSYRYSDKDQWSKPEKSDVEISIRESLMIVYTTPIQVLNYLKEIEPYIKSSNDDVTYECCDRNKKDEKCIVQISPIENNFVYLYIIKKDKQIRYTIKNE